MHAVLQKKKTPIKEKDYHSTLFHSSFVSFTMEGAKDELELVPSPVKWGEISFLVLFVFVFYFLLGRKCDCLCRLSSHPYYLHFLSAMNIINNLLFLKNNSPVCPEKVKVVVVRIYN